MIVNVYALLSTDWHREGAVYKTYQKPFGHRCSHTRTRSQQIKPAIFAFQVVAQSISESRLSSLFPNKGVAFKPSQIYFRGQRNHQTQNVV